MSFYEISIKLGVGFSTLQKWIRLAKDNQLEKKGKTMSKEKPTTTRRKPPLRQ